ncbi:hypothetical protein BD779DRAFT_1583591 [Infundibulicybe gibba]|nr:hypothetical protein BD779DRAFT_1583591 [Infundibulicybe gibba]
MILTMAATPPPIAFKMGPPGGGTASAMIARAPAVRERPSRRSDDVSVATGVAPEEDG